MSIESQVDTARRAVAGTGHAAAHLAASAWGSASEIASHGAELVEADVVEPIGRRARRVRAAVSPPPRRRRPPLAVWALLALVGVVVGAAVLRRRRFARLEVDRAGALVIDAPPDAFGAAVVATEAASS